MGGIIAGIEVPDRHGRPGSVVLGLDTLQQYETISATIHFGAIIGRFANRIADAQFTLDGKTYKLEANDGRNTLHSGPTVRPEGLGCDAGARAERGRG